LVEEEAEDVAQGKASLHEKSASIFLREGIELEDQR
jgi:hypothetical protein